MNAKEKGLVTELGISVAESVNLLLLYIMIYSPIMTILYLILDLIININSTVNVNITKLEFKNKDIELSSNIILFLLRSILYSMTFVLIFKYEYFYLIPISIITKTLKEKTLKELHDNII